MWIILSILGLYWSLCAIFSELTAEKVWGGIMIGLLVGFMFFIACGVLDEFFSVVVPGWVAILGIGVCMAIGLVKSFRIYGQKGL